MAFPELQRNPRYAILDAFRGVACLMVVLHHAGFVLLRGEAPESGPLVGLGRWINDTLRLFDLGVPLFFVISGYCIAASVDAMRRKGSSPGRFVVRRLWRIYPPYWAAVAWFLAVTIGFQKLGLERLLCCHSPYGLELNLPQDLNFAQWVGNLTLTETWRPRVWGGSGLIFTRVAWSLCYEEQFYFLCFLVLMLFSKRLFGAMAWMTALIVLIRVALADFGMIHRVQGTFFDLWHQFAVGLAVYWRLNMPGEPWKKRVVELSLLGMALIGFQERMVNTPVAYSTGTTAAFGLLLITIRDFDAPISRWLWVRPLSWIGRRSYSVYLYHLPVTTVGTFGFYELGITGFWPRVLITIPVVSIAAVAISCAFYAMVERHFLNPPIVGAAKTPPDASTRVTGESIAPSDRG